VASSFSKFAGRGATISSILATNAAHRQESAERMRTLKTPQGCRYLNPWSGCVCRNVTKVNFAFCNEHEFLALVRTHA
jgi:hypothetical protein